MSVLRRLRSSGKDEQVVRASPLFDSDWYRASHPDVGDRDPVADYLAHGGADQRDPGPSFSARRYLDDHADVARSGMDPLVHYERFGRVEGRRIRPSESFPPGRSEPDPRSAATPSLGADVDAERTAAIELLREAIVAFGNGHIEEARRLLTGRPDGGGDLGRTLWLMCDGLRAEESGDLATARDRIAQAVALNVPLPAILLAAGRFFKRMGDYEPAFRCFAILAATDPQAIVEFRTGLPSAIAGRFLPLMVAGIRQDEHPNLIVLGMAKSALAERIGPDGVGLLLAELSAPGEVRVPRVRRLVDVHAELRLHGKSITEVAPERELVLPAPEILGCDRAEGLPTRTRGVIRGTLMDSTVAGKSYAILREDRLILDARADELSWMPVDLSADMMIAGVEGDRLVTLEDPRPSIRLGMGFSLLGEHSGAFGHWMLEFLPRLWCAMADPAFGGATVLVDSQMPAQHLQAVRWFLGDDHSVRIVSPGEPVLVDRLLVATAPLYMPIAPLPPAVGPRDALRVDGPAFADVLRAALPPRAEDEPGPARVYLSRGARARRRLENREEIERIAMDHGFQVVDPGDLSFDRQVALVRDAEVVVMPDGSAAFLTFFAGPGARLGMLTNEYEADFEFLVAISEALGHRLLLLRGTQARRHERYPEMSDYLIPADGFRMLLRDLLGDG